MIADIAAEKSRNQQSVNDLINLENSPLSHTGACKHHDEPKEKKDVSRDASTGNRAVMAANNVNVNNANHFDHLAFRCCMCQQENFPIHPETQEYQCKYCGMYHSGDYSKASPLYRISRSNDKRNEPHFEYHRPRLAGVDDGFLYSTKGRGTDNMPSSQSQHYSQFQHVPPSQGFMDNSSSVQFLPGAAEYSSNYSEVDPFACNRSFSYFPPSKNNAAVVTKRESGDGYYMDQTQNDPSTQLTKNDERSTRYTTDVRVKYKHHHQIIHDNGRQVLVKDIPDNYTLVSTYWLNIYKQSHKFFDSIKRALSLKKFVGTKESHNIVGKIGTTYPRISACALNQIYVRSVHHYLTNQLNIDVSMEQIINTSPSSRTFAYDRKMVLTDRKNQFYDNNGPRHEEPFAKRGFLPPPTNGHDVKENSFS